MLMKVSREKKIHAGILENLMRIFAKIWANGRQVSMNKKVRDLSNFPLETVMGL
jgi:trans-2-enoyl-CoA reductase